MQHRFDASGNSIHRGAVLSKGGVYAPHYVYSNNLKDNAGYPDNYVKPGQTVLKWDRNNGGRKAGEFVKGGENGRNAFFYKDPDSNRFRYLVDTGNMKDLNAEFNSVKTDTLDVTGGLQGSYMLFRNSEQDKDYPHDKVSNGMTALQFDRNNTGDKAKDFARDGKHGANGTFYYKDADKNEFRHIIDTGNMKDLNAQFNTVSAKNVAGDEVSSNSELKANKGIRLDGPIRFMPRGNDPYKLEKLRHGGKDGHSLRMTINDNPNETFQIWGNSCNTTGCRGEGEKQHQFKADGDAWHRGTVKADKFCIGKTCIDENVLKTLTGQRPFTLRSNRTGRRLQDRGRDARFQNRNRLSWERMYFETF
jgi:hypothetical protein